MVRVIKRTQTLSLLDRGKTPREIADFLDTSHMTRYRVEEKYLEGGLDAAQPEPSRPSYGRVLDERQAVAILAMVCEAPCGSCAVDGSVGHLRGDATRDRE